MAVDLYRLLDILAAAIVFLALFRCIIVLDPDEGKVYDKLRNRANLPALLEVYYEAMDNTSEEFITNQLMPAYEKLENFADIMLVPYGRTHMYKNSNDSYEIRCMPNSAQCEANLQHACIMDNIADTQKLLQMIKCLMQSYKTMLPSDGLEKCSREIDVPEMNAIHLCLKSNEGMELLKLNNDLTAEASKPLYQLPFVIVNGEGISNVKLEENLMENLCKLMVRIKHENVCANK